VRQYEPAGQATGSVDLSGQYVPKVVHSSFAPPEQKDPDGQDISATAMVETISLAALTE
jgi:hypothetical protein